MARNIYYKKKSIWPAILIGVVAAIAVAAIVLLLLWDPTGGAVDTQAPSDTTTTTTETEVTTTTTQGVAGNYVITDKVNLRLGPGMEYDIIKVLQPGDVIEVLSEDNGWYCTTYNDVYAYFSAEFAVPSTAGESTAGTTATKTTTTTTTKATKTSKTSQKYTDRYIDENGMLQFEPGNNYVQKNSYADGAIPWNLLLVNDWNPMEKGYDETVEMVKASPSATTQPVDARIKKDLEAMLKAGKAYNIGVQSGYRSASKQGELYQRQVNYYKTIYSDPVVYQTKAGEVVKRPGFSEHNTGLAVDLYGSGDHSLTASFAKTPAYEWLLENCADYGFILRFPKGKESITGVIYEAWHFRYVGDPAIAHEIMDNGLCLEEYLAQTNQ